MRLSDYSLDDLHLAAIAELDDDDAAVEILNTLYSDLRRAYVSAYLRLREITDTLEVA